MLVVDFISNYIFLVVGRVGSSTYLIVQRVDFVHDVDKRSHLMDLIHAWKAKGNHGKVSVVKIVAITVIKSFTYMITSALLKFRA